MTEEEFKQVIEIDNSTQRLKHRENTWLEFKENFNRNDFAIYGKVLSSFANNNGGIIVFGIKDKPRQTIGMRNNNFENLDEKDLSNFLNEHFSPELKFETYQFTIDNKKFGVIEIEKSNDKPVICIKTGGKKQEIQESEIYYRYSGRSEKIKYSELKYILDNNLEEERQKWREHIEKIATVGAKNIKMLDLLRGEIEVENGRKIVVDKDLLKNIKLVDEGRFVEKDGAPALKIIGSIENGELITPKLNLSEDFYTAKELLNKLGLNVHYSFITGIVKEFNIDQNEDFFQQKKQTKLYSRLCLDFLKNKKLTENQVKDFFKKHRNKK